METFFSLLLSISTIFNKGVLLRWTISEICSCYKKAKNCYDEGLLYFFKTTSILTISSYLCDRILNSIKNISLCVADGNLIICMEEDFATLSQLERGYFYRTTILAFGIDQFALVLDICLSK